MAKQIILKPVFSEKAQDLETAQNKFTFVVAKTANKHQIREAVTEMFDVKVEAVNTLRMPAKLRRRFTKRGLELGKRNAYKKAVITLKAGETIETFGAPDFDAED